jgi:phytanoyl-CoA hydroxylase
MLTNDQVATYQKNGYLLGPQVLSDAEVDELRTELDRVIRDRDKGGSQPVLLRDISRDPAQQLWQIVNISDASAAFRRLVHHPIISGEVAQLTGAREVRLWHDQVQYKVAGRGAVNMWHQDWPYWGILDAPHQVTAWVALDDVDPGNGCMSMVPGSHLWGKQIDFLHKLPAFDAMPDRFAEHELTVRTCPVRKGQVHYHHALTWHGSPANTSNRPRRAIALHFMTEQTRYVAAGNHVMKPFVTVPDGAPLQGPGFALVWTAEKTVG